jgi:general secretion pathway protein I
MSHRASHHRASHPCAHAHGFTLIEVLVALAIVSITLIAGLQASAAITRNAERQTDRILAQLCAENALATVRLSRQLPNVGENTVPCEQAGRALEVRLVVQPTPNPNFRRVDARLYRDQQPLLQLSTILGRY